MGRDDTGYFGQWAKTPIFNYIKVLCNYCRGDSSLNYLAPLEYNKVRWPDRW